MKTLLASAALIAQLALPAFAADLSAKDVAAIEKVIEASNAAFLRGDAGAIADVTSERLLEAVGGRAKYVESIQAGIAGVHAQGITIVSHAEEPPAPPVKAGAFIVSVVKETTIMEARGRKMRNDGFTVVVRPAAGGPWKLIGGNGVSQNPGVMAMLYPGFPEDYKFPPYTTVPM